MTNDQATPVALTIAGSDSGGGAGIQADLKTFSALNVFGTSAITCVTAQNPDKVSGVTAVDADMVSLQIRTVCEGFPVAAAKTGMLYSASIIRAVSHTLTECGISMLVVDPVMVATSGARLLREDAVKVLCSELIPKSTVITPNVPEAEILCGHSIHSLDELKDAAREIGERFDVACVANGGHLRIADCGLRIAERGTENAECGVKKSSEIWGGDVVDVLFDGSNLKVFSTPRVDAEETHGTGCMFSAALTAFLAQGKTLLESLEQAKEFVTNALKHTVHVGTHYSLWG